MREFSPPCKSVCIERLHLAEHLAPDHDETFRSVGTFEFSLESLRAVKMTAMR